MICRSIAIFYLHLFPLRHFLPVLPITFVALYNFRYTPFPLLKKFLLQKRNFYASRRKNSSGIGRVLISLAPTQLTKHQKILNVRCKRIHLYLTTSVLERTHHSSTYSFYSSA